VKVGDEVEVRIIDVNPKKRQIKLSMKPDTVEIASATTEPEESVLTPMQLAFQAAQQQNQPIPSTKTVKTTVKRDEHEDIFARTIQQHRATNG
jgi:ribosomal protein S1